MTQTPPNVAESQGLYTMAVACQLTGLSQRTLRLYEEEGLIRPARRSEGGQRLYSNQDLEWIRCIRELVHEHGLTTTAIRRLLDLIPCWEVKRCSLEQAQTCARALNIPDMATGKDSRAPDTVEASAAGADAALQPTLQFLLFYGVAEFGAVLSCTRCIQAERVIRRIAAKHGIPVEVHKHDITSGEADQYGVVLTPTIILNGKLLSSGKSLSDAKLEKIMLEEKTAQMGSRSS
jgi:MerR family transcriptional regulator, heat shock protein HspR